MVAFDAGAPDECGNLAMSREWRSLLVALRRVAARSRNRAWLATVGAKNRCAHVDAQPLAYVHQNLHCLSELPPIFEEPDVA